MGSCSQMGIFCNNSHQSRKRLYFILQAFCWAVRHHLVKQYGKGTMIEIVEFAVAMLKRSGVDIPFHPSGLLALLLYGAQDSGDIYQI